MKRINKKLLEALDKLIAKYSGEELIYIIDYMGCPLCDLFFKEDYPMGKECTKCPNTYFGGYIGCANRAIIYSICTGIFILLLIDLKFNKNE